MPTTKAENIKLIVCNNAQEGADFAQRQGWTRTEVRMFSCSHPGGANRLRGYLLSRSQVYDITHDRTNWSLSQVREYEEISVALAWAIRD